MRKMTMLAAAAAMALVSQVNAAQLLDFKTNAISPDQPEFAINGGVVTVGPGASHLIIEVPFIVPGAIPGKTITPAGTTVFSDVSFTMAAAPLLSAGATSDLGGGLLLISAPLGTTTFAFYANGPVGTAPILLLEGTTAPSVLAGLQGFHTANIQTPTLTYDGLGAVGAIIGVVGGDASYSLNDVTPVFGLNTDAHLYDATANATGLFGIVPEPSTTCLVAGAAIGLIARRKRA